MFAVIDCGSASTEVFIVDENNKILTSAAKNIGVQSVASTGSKEILKQGIREALSLAAENLKIELSKIEFAIAFGMITSEMGLKEVPHMIAPAGIDELASNIEILENTDVFPSNIPIILVRGLKNPCKIETYDDVRNIDLMRGEETQIIGLLETLKPSLPVNIIQLGFTTKLIHINKEGKICGSITALSGQVYEAIKKETFIGKCVKPKNEDEKIENFFSEKILKAAENSVKTTGLLRTVMLTRFSEISLSTNWQELKFFLESAIAADDTKILDEAEKLLGFDLDTDFILIGDKERATIYEYIIKSRNNYNKEITTLYKKKDIDMLGIIGAALIAEKAKGMLKSKNH